MDKQSGISPRFNIKANQRLGIGGAEVKTPVCEGQAQAVAVVAFACDRGIVRGDVIEECGGLVDRQVDFTRHRIAGLCVTHKKRAAARLRP